MAKEKKICSTCNGKGWVPNPKMDTRDPKSADNIPCSKCGGDGWIYV